MSVSISHLIGLVMVEDPIKRTKPLIPNKTLSKAIDTMRASSIIRAGKSADHTLYHAEPKVSLLSRIEPPLSYELPVANSSSYSQGFWKKFREHAILSRRLHYAYLSES